MTRKEFVDAASVGLVVVCGALTGHFASVGMNVVQWAGAATAVLGSISLAVTLRVWPEGARAKAKAKAPQRD
ncbi:MAG TPA: hypothetical protein VGC92_15635 [Phenylobacterium sp.]